MTVELSSLTDLASESSCPGGVEVRDGGATLTMPAFSRPTGKDRRTAKAEIVTGNRQSWPFNTSIVGVEARPLTLTF